MRRRSKIFILNFNSGFRSTSGSLQPLYACFRNWILPKMHLSIVTRWRGLQLGSMIKVLNSRLLWETVIKTVFPPEPLPILS